MLFRPALRACERVTFVGCNKSNQKGALRAAAGGGADRRVWGLGVRHGVSIVDLLVRAERSALAPGQSEDSGFDGYRSGLVSIESALIRWGCWSGFQYPPKHTMPRNRHDPAPTVIEAGITLSPVSQRGTCPTDKKISNQCPDQTPNPSSIDLQLNSLPPVKSAFAYLSGACEKSVASKREARGEMVLEVGFDSKAAAPGQGARITAGRNGY